LCGGDEYMYKIIYNYKDDYTVDWNEATVIVGSYKECIELINSWRDSDVQILSVEKFK
jgi:hypothetical protein